MDWLLEHHEEIRNLGLVAAAAIGLPLAIWRSFIAQKQTRIATDNHLAETYTKAIDQLGRTENEIRLGGLYALENIAQTNQHYHGQIMEVLCAFVRLHAAGKAEISEKNHKSHKLVIHTILAIISRLNNNFENSSFFKRNVGKLISYWNKKLDLNWFEDFAYEALKKTIDIDLKSIILWDLKIFNGNFSNGDFSEADLTGAYLSLTNFSETTFINTDLSETNLSSANLSYADLYNSNLHNSNLLHADLSNAFLVEANLSKTNLIGANLSNACLERANLTGANLKGANLSNAKPEKADLTGAIVTPKQLRSARVYENTILPDDIDKKSLTFEKKKPL
ncbi:MAG: pentapeptide repeat-containing protein [Nitrospinae bacterium]|nr:pentapeptide repeat-containing protein [Nitrospinota bacterium]MBL7021414.1 pentapeptide repeat-containing protein [Nitrospinaceae bacterium]